MINYMLRRREALSTKDAAGKKKPNFRQNFEKVTEVSREMIVIHQPVKRT